MYAQHALRTGQHALAEALAGEFLGRVGPHPEALLIVAAVADRAQRPDLAKAWAAHALQLDPSQPDARRLLDRAERALPQYIPEHARPGAGERFLLITAWGHGFWSDVDHVLAGLLIAELTGRTPLVYWGPDSKYADAGSANAWTDFFDPVSGADLAAVLGLVTPGSVHPAKWTPERIRRGEFERMSTRPLPTAIELFNRPEPVVVADVHSALISLLSWLPADHRLAGRTVKEAYRDLIGRYLRPRVEILQAATAFIREQLRPTSAEGQPVLAVHYRGSDKHTEDPTAARVQGQYATFIAEFFRSYPQGRIFFFTDSQQALAQYRQQYPGKLVTTSATRTSDKLGLHFQTGHDRRQLGVEVLMDVLIAAECDLFLGFGYSNVSCYVEFMKDWPEGSTFLLGDYVLGISDAMMLMEPTLRQRFMTGQPPA